MLATCCHSSHIHPIPSRWASVSLIGRNLKSHRKSGFLSSFERGGDGWPGAGIQADGWIGLPPGLGLGP